MTVLLPAEHSVLNLHMPSVCAAATLSSKLHPLQHAAAHHTLHMHSGLAWLQIAFAKPAAISSWLFLSLVLQVQLYMYNPTYLLSQLMYNLRVRAASLQIATTAQAMLGMWTTIRNLSALEGNAVSAFLRWGWGACCVAQLTVR